jgi:hypothetical protein
MASMTSWFITIGSFKRKCDTCDKSILPQTPFAYRHETATSLCMVCAENDGLMVEPSHKYLKFKEAKRVERIAKEKAKREPTLF